MQRHMPRAGKRADKKILVIGSIVTLALLLIVGKISQGRAEKASREALASVAEDTAAEEKIRAEVPQTANQYTKLWVPTSIRKIGDLWFIVDCYHNQILFHKDVNGEATLQIPLNEWQVLPGQFKGGHTICGDGEVFLADDTENNRVETFVRHGDQFELGQVFTGIGSRPHCTYYDPENRIFYVWSSQTGEMYLFSRKNQAPSDSDTASANQASAGQASAGQASADQASADQASADQASAGGSGASEDTCLELRAIHSFEEMKDTYVRSFTVCDGSMWFVSGVKLSALSGNPDTAAANTSDSNMAEGTDTAAGGASDSAADGSGKSSSLALGSDKISKGPRILQYSMPDLRLVKEYPVPDRIAGMVQMIPDKIPKSSAEEAAVSAEEKNDNTEAKEEINDNKTGETAADRESNDSEAGEDTSSAGHGWYITISTDADGNQDAAGMIHAADLGALAGGSDDSCEDVWNTNFEGGGAPYFINEAGGRFYTVAGDNSSHTVWAFTPDGGLIRDVLGFY